MYFTLFETHNVLTGKITIDGEEHDFTRGGGLALGLYYVNGPMILGYDMDPLGWLPAHLIHEDIWWRAVGWYGYVPVEAYDEPALCLQAPNVASRGARFSPPLRTGTPSTSPANSPCTRTT